MAHPGACDTWLPPSFQIVPSLATAQRTDRAGSGPALSECLDAAFIAGRIAIGSAPDRSWGLGMQRREFIAALGGAATLPVAWPFTARAQQAAGARRVGALHEGSPTDTGSVGRRRLDAFKKGLADLGWIEGRNVRFEERWGDHRTERRGGFENIGGCFAILFLQSRDFAHVIC